jgi:hypothetical protein
MRFFAFLLLFIGNYIYGQSTYDARVSNPITFFNHQTGKFTVIDDSLGCHEYNEKKNKWEFKKLTFLLEESFSDFLKDYCVLHEIGSSIFFVERGCGYVYILENDTLKRHDRTFHHKNQYFGTVFLYKGIPHIFGGYGLFTFKNIITYYSPKDREWFHYSIKGDAPSPRFLSHGKLVDNKFYISSGSFEKGVYLTDCWSFDLVKLKWDYIGEISNKEIIKSYFDYFLDEIRVLQEMMNQEYLTFGNNIFKIDYENNALTKYIVPSDEKLKRLIAIGNKILYLKSNHNKSSFQVIVENASDFFPVSKTTSLMFEKKKFEKDSPSYFLIVFGIISLLIFFWILIRFIKSKRKSRVGFDMDFNRTEKDLIQCFCDNAENGIEISHVSDFVNSDNPSADTLKKRREGLIKSLRLKISSDCQISFDDVFIETKHPQDKRIKILVLHPKAINRYQNKF